jgi:hypothetical protein
VHDARSANGLRQVLVRGADDHALDARVGGRRGGARRQRIVCLELDHRPHDEARGDERLFQDRELREEILRDAGARLVPAPQAVAKRLDDVIRGDGDVRRAVGNHPEHRGDDAANRGHLAAVDIALRRPGKVVPEQLSVPSTRCTCTGYRLQGSGPGSSGIRGQGQAAGSPLPTHHST